MKYIAKISVLFILSALITACAATSRLQAPDKYSLGDQLQQIKIIRNPWITDWEDVDYQSLFIRTTLNNYYLLILKTPCIELPFQENISISYSDDMIMAGFSSVIVSVGANMKYSYLIDRIYRVNSTEEMRVVRDQLKGR